MFSKYDYQEKTNNLKTTKLNKNDLQNLFNVMTISINKRNNKIVLQKKCFENTYFIIFNENENKYYKLKRKSLNIIQNSAKSVFEIETFGKAFVEFNNGKKFTFYVIPEVLYKLLKFNKR